MWWMFLAFGCGDGTGLVVLNDPPTANIVSPAEGAVVRVGSTLDLQGEVQDDTTAMADLRVRWFVAGEEVCSGPPNEDGTTQCEVVLEDDATISLSAVDLQGESAEDSVLVEVAANTPPELVIVSPTADHSWFDTGVPLEATVSDADDAPEALSLVWTLDGNEVDVIDPFVDSSGVFTGTAMLAAGDYTLRATLTDTEGATASERVSFTVLTDIEPPECAIVAPEGGELFDAADGVAFEASVIDDRAAPDQVVSTLVSSQDGDLLLPPHAAANGDLVHTLVGLSPGAHTLTLRSEDPSDNVCTDTVSFSVCDTPWYADTDGDGFGDVSSLVYACRQPDGYVGDASDCDDTRGDVHPGATEVCNDIDDDCDSAVDDADTALVAEYAYQDADGDGFGNPTTGEAACALESGQLRDATDCDDARADTFPGAAPNDSDTLCLTDADGDDYGDNGTPGGTDCNDASDVVNADADEVCNGVDDDCDGAVDDADTGLVADPSYADTDGDGFGDPTTAAPTCSVTAGRVLDNTDCDDTRADTFPGAAPLDSASLCLTDADGDDYGDDAAAGGSDCDDSTAAVHPAATEVCNGIDDDCDSAVDDADTDVDAPVVYGDGDGDGFGNSRVTDNACVPPDGFADNRNDCDDANALIYPGAVELCDGVRNDCDNSSWTSDDNLASLHTVRDGWVDYTTELVSGDRFFEDDATLAVCLGNWGASIAVDGAELAISCPMHPAGETCRGLKWDLPADGLVATGSAGISVEGIALRGANTTGAVVSCSNGSLDFTASSFQSFATGDAAPLNFANCDVSLTDTTVTIDRTSGTVRALTQDTGGTLAMDGTSFLLSGDTTLTTSGLDSVSMNDVQFEGAVGLTIEQTPVVTLAGVTSTGTLDMFVGGADDEVSTVTITDVSIEQPADADVQWTFRGGRADLDVSIDGLTGSAPIVLGSAPTFRVVANGTGSFEMVNQDTDYVQFHYDVDHTTVTLADLDVTANDVLGSEGPLFRLRGDAALQRITYLYANINTLDPVIDIEPGMSFVAEDLTFDWVRTNNRPLVTLERLPAGTVQTFERLTLVRSSFNSAIVIRDSAGTVVCNDCNATEDSSISDRGGMFLVLPWGTDGADLQPPGALTINGGVFENGFVREVGGHISVQDAIDLTISNATFDDGYADVGSSIYLSGAATASVSNTVFSNAASGLGPFASTVYSNGAEVTLTDTEFVGCQYPIRLMNAAVVNGTAVTFSGSNPSSEEISHGSGHTNMTNDVPVDFSCTITGCVTF